MEYNWILYSKNDLPDIFAAPLGQFGKFIAADNSKKVDDHDLMILDCISYSPNELVNFVKDSKEMVEKNKPILLIKPTSAHKKVLAKASILSTYIPDDSLALFIEPRRDKAGNLRIALAEHFGISKEGYVERTLNTYNKENKLVNTKTDKFQVSNTTSLNINDLASFIERIRHSIHSLSSGKVADASGDVGPNSPPSDLPAGLWNNTPINIYVTINPAGSPAEGYSPPIGNVTLEALVSVGVYYDNKKYTTPIQWLYIEHSGHLSTTMNENNDDRRGWSLGYLKIDGENISSPTIVSSQSKPNNVNEQTQYTTSTEFSVGVSAGTDGLSSDVSYSIGSSETCNISDWKVVQNDANSWLLDQQRPYDGASTGFPDGAAGYDGVNSVPTISSSTLAFNTQTVWAQNPAARNSMNISYNYEVKSYFIWADKHNSTEWHAYSWGYTMPVYRNFLVNFSKAYPDS